LGAGHPHHGYHGVVLGYEVVDLERGAFEGIVEHGEQLAGPLLAGSQSRHRLVLDEVVGDDLVDHAELTGVHLDEEPVDNGLVGFGHGAASLVRWGFVSMVIVRDK
jgi:hypothetical protein